ncbi:MAG: hypothetical protein IPL46_00210 [Saprospiraceae bacterium]|nr:hypothetical protein [Saprospiraceae bacterium]
MLIALLPLVDRMPGISAKATSVKITCWYGKEQVFGQIALTQRWINVLGNISPSENIAETFYEINDQVIPFKLGPDLHRLARSGDFNLDIPLTELTDGVNHLVITAISSNGDTIREDIDLRIYKNRNWPLPYEVDFSEIKRIQESVQVVDGLWKLTKAGIRTVEPYYYRALSIGDTSWSNFEATIKVTIHDWTPSQPGPPTYNVSHFGVAMYWRGHHTDDLQPHRKWFPLGAQGEFLLKEATDSCRWRILLDGGKETKAPIYAVGTNRIQKEQPMWFKAQVTTIENGSTRYLYRQWVDGVKEPEKWDVSGIDEHDYPSGSLCIVPHNSDVTIHQIRIVPLEK